MAKKVKLKALQWFFLQGLSLLLIILGVVALLFLIGHDLSGVESWISESCWELLFFGKLVTLFFWLKLKRLSLRDLCNVDKKEREGQYPLFSLFILTSFLSLFALLHIDFSNSVSLYMSSYREVISLFALYTIDLLVISEIYEESEHLALRGRIIDFVYLSVISTLTYRLSFINAHLNIYLFICHGLMTWYFLIVLRLEWKMIMIFHFVIAVTFSVLMQSNQKSFLELNFSSDWQSNIEYIAVLFVLTAIYTISSKGLLRPKMK